VGGELKNKMPKNKFNKNLKLGFKLSLVGIIPSLVASTLFYFPNLSMDSPGLKEGLILGGAIIINLYLLGLFVNKWKKWIFK